MIELLQNTISLSTRNSAIVKNSIISSRPYGSAVKTNNFVNMISVL